MTIDTTETVYAKYEFTNTELLALSQEMAQAASKKKGSEDQLKSVQSSIKADINAEDAIINRCAEKISNGYEMKPYTCSRRYQAERKIVEFVDTETGEVIQTRPMTKDEQFRF